MNENTMTEFKSEGQPAFPDTSKEGTSTESSTENANVDQTGASDQNKKDDGTKTDGVDERLFNHPRWTERETDWKNRFNDQEKRHTEEIAKLREEFTGAKGKETTTKAAPMEVPAWFGGDENQWAEFLSWNQGLVSKAKEEARAETLKEIESRTTAEQKAVDDATKFFNDEVTAIETDKTINPQGIKVDRNKLLKTALDFELVDLQGRWNYRAAWRFLQNAGTKGNATQDRKEIAGATTSDRGGESKPSAFVTSKDFQNPANRPW